MLIKVKRGWELPEQAATPEPVFHDRRRLLKAAAAGPTGTAVSQGFRTASRMASDVPHRRTTRS